MPIVRMLTPLVAVLGVVARAEAQTVHKIQLEVDRAKEIYQFTPSRVMAAPGDILLFHVVSGAPHSIVFEAKGHSPAALGALSAALGRRSGDLSSPMLAKDGAEYRLTLPNLPPGAYGYFCLPHRAYDMRGRIIVQKGR